MKFSLISGDSQRYTGRIRMHASRRTLCVIYALIAVAALVGTWAHNFAYLKLGWLAANMQFWIDTLVSHASASITVDLFFFGLAVNLWMVLEARRIGLRWVWGYVIAGLLVAISVAFPLYMIHRERVLATRGEAADGPGLGAGDVIGLVALAAGACAFTVWSFH